MRNIFKFVLPVALLFIIVAALPVLPVDFSNSAGFGLAQLYNAGTGGALDSGNGNSQLELRIEDRQTQDTLTGSTVNAGGAGLISPTADGGLNNLSVPLIPISTSPSQTSLTIPTGDTSGGQTGTGGLQTSGGGYVPPVNVQFPTLTGGGTVAPTQPSGQTAQDFFNQYVAQQQAQQNSEQPAATVTAQPTTIQNILNLGQQFNASLDNSPALTGGSSDTNAPCDCAAYKADIEYCEVQYNGKQDSSGESHGINKQAYAVCLKQTNEKYGSACVAQCAKTGGGSAGAGAAAGGSLTAVGPSQAVNQITVYAPANAIIYTQGSGTNQPPRFLVPTNLNVSLTPDAKNNTAFTIEIGAAALTPALITGGANANLSKTHLLSVAAQITSQGSTSLDTSAGAVKLPTTFWGIIKSGIANLFSGIGGGSGSGGAGGTGGAGTGGTGGTGGPSFGTTGGDDVVKRGGCNASASDENGEPICVAGACLVPDTLEPGICQRDCTCLPSGIENKTPGTPAGICGKRTVNDSKGPFTESIAKKLTVPLTSTGVALGPGEAFTKCSKQNVCVGKDKNNKCVNYQVITVCTTTTRANEGAVQADQHAIDAAVDGALSECNEKIIEKMNAAAQAAAAANPISKSFCQPPGVASCAGPGAKASYDFTPCKIDSVDAKVVQGKNPTAEITIKGQDGSGTVALEYSCSANSVEPFEPTESAGETPPAGGEPGAPTGSGGGGGGGANAPAGFLNDVNAFVNRIADILNPFKFFTGAVNGPVVATCAAPTQVNDPSGKVLSLEDLLNQVTDLAATGFGDEGAGVLLEYQNKIVCSGATNACSVGSCSPRLEIVNGKAVASCGCSGATSGAGAGGGETSKPAPTSGQPTAQSLCNSSQLTKSDQDSYKKLQKDYAAKLLAGQTAKIGLTKENQAKLDAYSNQLRYSLTIGAKCGTGSTCKATGGCTVQEGAEGDLFCGCGADRSGDGEDSTTSDGSIPPVSNQCKTGSTQGNYNGYGSATVFSGSDTHGGQKQAMAQALKQCTDSLVEDAGAASAACDSLCSGLNKSSGLSCAASPKQDLPVCELKESGNGTAVNPATGKTEWYYKAVFIANKTAVVPCNCGGAGGVSTGGAPTTGGAAGGGGTPPTPTPVPPTAPETPSSMADFKTCAQASAANLSAYEKAYGEKNQDSDGVAECDPANPFAPCNGVSRDGKTPTEAQKEFCASRTATCGGKQCVARVLTKAERKLYPDATGECSCGGASGSSAAGSGTGETPSGGTPAAPAGGTKAGSCVTIALPTSFSFKSGFSTKQFCVGFGCGAGKTCGFSNNQCGCISKPASSKTDSSPDAAPTGPVVADNCTAATQAIPSATQAEAKAKLSELVGLQAEAAKTADAQARYDAIVADYVKELFTKGVCANAGGTCKSGDQGCYPRLDASGNVSCGCSASARTSATDGTGSTPTGGTPAPSAQPDSSCTLTLTEIKDASGKSVAPSDARYGIAYAAACSAKPCGNGGRCAQDSTTRACGICLPGQPTTPAGAGVPPAPTPQPQPKPQPTTSGASCQCKILKYGRPGCGNCSTLARNLAKIGLTDYEERDADNEYPEYGSTYANGESCEVLPWTVIDCSSCGGSKTRVCGHSDATAAQIKKLSGR